MTRDCFYVLALVLPLNSLAASVVAIDVGHGHRDGGAQSARGRPEFAFNLDFSRQLARQVIQRGIGVQPVNFDGQIASLRARPAAAKGADVFVSIHHDSVSEAYLQPWQWQGQTLTHTTVKRGFGLFVSADNPDLESSLRCASTVGAMLRRAGFVPSEWHARKHLPADAANGVWYYDNLVVLYRTTLPAVLFEAGVIKHQDEEVDLRDPARQARMADAVATGLAACLQVKEKPARD
ncbi:MAG: N-acetylmuramoyl-L-alanine amidase [Dechloromonas sp.]|nr:N-acetylmuramoyl-L-alanine amidase [Dechloromonas sp.]